MTNSSVGRRSVVLLVALLVALAGVPGLAAAETRAAGTVTVTEGETLDGLSAFAGTVVVRGTVDGDLDGAAGSVVVEPTGVVTGDLSILAGNVRISGQVDGDVSGAAGSVTLTREGAVGGDLRSGAGSVLIEGTVGGSALLGAGSIHLAETASVAGDVRYDPDSSFRNDGAAIGGSLVADDGLGVDFSPLPEVAAWLFTGYFLAVNLLVGAVLLLGMPRYSRRVSDTLGDDPLVSGGAGLVALVGIPLGLLALAITVVGIPLTIVGAFLFAVLLWVGLVYGRIAVAAWALRRVGVESPWAALPVGVVGLGLLSLVPVLGALLDLATLLLGLGAVVLAAVAVRREGGRRDAPAPAERDGSGPDGGDVSPF
jgi:cytoskeletal protein CcmA (bactofilin family)